MNLLQDSMYIVVSVVVLIIIFKLLLGNIKLPTEDFVCARCKTKPSIT